MGHNVFQGDPLSLELLRVIEELKNEISALTDEVYLLEQARRKSLIVNHELERRLQEAELIISNYRTQAQEPNHN